jgi:hypothetical protein
MILLSPSDVVPANAPLLALLPPQQSNLSRHRACPITCSCSDEGEFTEGHELPDKMRVPKPMIGRRLSQTEAKRLLANLG